MTPKVRVNDPPQESLMRPHRLLQPIHESIPCPWSAAHPRHDHQLIFPLAEDRLILVWSEYYVDRPSNIRRKVTDRETGTGDEAPCRLSAVTEDFG